MEGNARRFALAVACNLIPIVASAGPLVSNITVRREPNLTSVAIQAIVSGDDDSTAVLRLFQKWADKPQFDTGMVLVRRPGTRIHEGRILFMMPGRIAHWYIEARDGAQVFQTPLQLARVDAIRPASASGPVFYADQRVGSDTWDGASPRYLGGTRGPTRTIAAALRALAASPDAGRSGGVFVGPGEYHEALTLGFGTDGDRRFLAGTGRAPDSTIICGATPWVEQGLIGPARSLTWNPVSDSVWAAYFPASTPGSSPGDSVQLVVLGDREYLHRKTSLRGLLADATWAGRSESTTAGERSGWFWQRDTLYVKRANGGAPFGMRVHTGYLDAMVDVQRRNWRISNLTFQYAGGTSGDPTHPANPDPGLSGRGIIAGVHGWASGLVVDSCRFVGLNADAIYCVHNFAGQHADSVTIAHCTFDGLTIGRMGYGAGKARAEESAGEVTLLSRASNVYANTFRGTFNGLEAGPGDPVAGPRDSTWGSQMEVAYNTFETIADDGIELDTSHCINTLLFGNTLRECGHGISQVPIYTGPVFVFYNTIANTRDGGIKVGSGTTAVMWYVHNTLTASNIGGWALDGSPGGPVENLHFRNNIMVARGSRSGYTIWGPSAASYTSNDFNYDLMDSTSTLALAKWGGQTYSFAKLQTLLDWETNGVRASPIYVDSTRFDWRLQPYSPGVGHGQRMTGINTSLDGPRYSGAAPDIGASSLPALTDAPGTEQPPLVFSVRATPNPARWNGAIEFMLPATTEVDAALFDVAGRRIRTLADHLQMAPGPHRLAWDTPRLAPGLYFYDVRAGLDRARGKLVVLE